MRNSVLQAANQSIGETSAAVCYGHEPNRLQEQLQAAVQKFIRDGCNPPLKEAAGRHKSEKDTRLQRSRVQRNHKICPV